MIEVYKTSTDIKVCKKAVAVPRYPLNNLPLMTESMMEQKSNGNSFGDKSGECNKCWNRGFLGEICDNCGNIMGEICENFDSLDEEESVASIGREEEDESGHEEFEECIFSNTQDWPEEPFYPQKLK